MLSHPRVDPEHLLLAAARLGNVEHLLAGHPAPRRSRSARSTGKPCLVAQQDGVTVTVFAFDVAGDRITHIWAVRNPDKLWSCTAH